MQESYQVSENRRYQYAGLFVMEQMQKKSEEFFCDLPSDQKVLEPVFKWLREQNYVGIDQVHKYELTPGGLEVLVGFRDRFHQFLRESDIYCAVDLGAGEFAFSHYSKFTSQTEWEAFLHEERWEDLRIAVAEHRGQDIVEIIFMDFVNENHFGKDEHGLWSFDRTLGSVWSEIEDIATNSLHTRHLAYEDAGELVSGQAVMEDILQQGSELNSRIHA